MTDPIRKARALVTLIERLPAAYEPGVYRTRHATALRLAEELQAFAVQSELYHIADPDPLVSVTVAHDLALFVARAFLGELERKAAHPAATE